MTKDLLTQARLRELLHYDPETGAFRWLITKGRAMAGDIPKGKNSCGYLRIMLDRIRYQAHRLAWFYMHDVFPADQIDHINGKRDDNRIANLREATSSLNQQNQRRARRNNKLGLLGVNRNGNRFDAQIQMEGKKYRLGTHSTPELAHSAYLAAKRQLHQGCTI